MVNTKHCQNIFLSFEAYFGLDYSSERDNTNALSAVFDFVTLFETLMNAIILIFDWKFDFQ